MSSSLWSTTLRGPCVRLTASWSPTYEAALRRIGFWEKAQLGFGQANDSDILGARYLLGGVIEESHASGCVVGVGLWV